MKNTGSFKPFQLLLLPLIICLGVVQTLGQKPLVKGSRSIDLSLNKPETVGFSSARLERVHEVMQRAVDQKQIPGIVTILARHGKIVDYRAYGQRDVASGAPMTKDAIFRDFHDRSLSRGKNSPDALGRSAGVCLFREFLGASVAPRPRFPLGVEPDFHLLPQPVTDFAED